VAGTIRVDDKHWPLVVVTFDGAAAGPSFERYLARMEQYLDRKERHGYLLDGREGAMMAGPERKVQAEWLKKHEANLRRYSIGTALVLRSAAVRFMLSAIYLIQEPVAPTETFGTVEEAHRWLVTTFGKEGLSVPPRSSLSV
jgi:hypothetical protein